MKQKLDERQMQEAAKITAISFYVMYGVCAVSILLQLVITGRIQDVAGETITLIAGGIVCLTGTVKKGLDSGKSHSFMHTLLESIVFSAVFTVLYALALQKKAGPEAEIAAAVLLFFMGITVLCFFTLKLMDSMAERKRKKQEQKYSDEG